MVIHQNTVEWQPLYACGHADEPWQPPVFWRRLSRYVRGSHISFFYKVFMSCWWCTATRNWRHGGTRWGIQGPAVHFYCQGCCDNYITSWDNLETSFPSALKLVAVFPFWSLGKERIGVESNGGGAEHTIMHWYAAGTSKPFLKVPTVTASSTEATCRHLYKYITIH